MRRISLKASKNFEPCSNPRKAGFSRWTEVAGLHAEWRSYEAVGRWVARNCDLLIAIWDDGKKGDRGGTEDVVRYAVRIGLPVWWIHASGAKPGVLIEDLDQFRKRSDPEQAATSGDRLRRYIRVRLQVPELSQPERQGIHHRLVAAGQWVGRKLHVLRRGEENPLHDFLAETPPRRRAAWRAHRIFMAALCLGLPRMRPKWWANFEDAYWEPIYRLPDALAESYADRYRSTYTYVFGFAALALTLAALSLAMEASGVDGPIWSIAAGEFVCLAAILALATWNLVERWHERWIGYRVPRGACAQTAGAGGARLDVAVARDHASGGDRLRTGVMDRLVLRRRHSRGAAGQWIAGEPAARDRAKRIYDSLVAGQIAYHTDRAAASKRAALVLLVLGEVCFFLTLLAIAAKLGLFIWPGPRKRMPRSWVWASSRRRCRRCRPRPSPCGLMRSSKYWLISPSAWRNC